MLDNQLIILVTAALETILTSIGQNYDIQQKYQPEQEGTPSQPTLFIYKISDRRVGSPARTDIWTPGQVAAFSGSITGNILTVTSVDSGQLAVFETILGPNIPGNTMITAKGELDGTWVLNQTFAAPTGAIDMTAIAGELHTETQQYETTFQLSALSIQSPSDPNQLTAADILNYAAYALQSSAMVTQLEANNVGILRVTDVRNPYFTDDLDRFEASPSFDFVLTHKQIIVTATPVVQSFELQILEV